MTLALQAERLERRANLDAAAPQDAEQRAQRDRVLRGPSGNHVRVWPLAPAADRTRLDVEEVGEPALAVGRRMRQQCIGAFRLIRNDVTQRPPPPAPGV